MAFLLAAAASMLAPMNGTEVLNFSEWVANHNKHYVGLSELNYRREVYQTNVDKILEHNAANHSWTMGLNKFADLTAEEFKARYTGGFSGASKVKQNHTYKHSGNLRTPSTLPESIDWREQGAVTPVKNQQQCGSCWSFSTTGSVEGAWFIAKGELVNLSEQQLVDCSTAEGNQGCNGGMMDYAFQYIINNKGITTEVEYPYTATGPNECQATGKPVAATLTSYTDVPTNSDMSLATAVAQQPVSVAIEADQAAFQFYTGGIMTATCGTNLDHGVLVVGYTSDAWIVKNSWGPDWGDQGYIQLGRGTQFGASGQCGILEVPSFPNVI